MKAYAILSGGGVKGAALAGCINAARHVGIEFVGYGGSSAGSIVSLLASIGYEGDELKGIAIDEMPFDRLLDDGGDELEKVKAQVDVLLKESTSWNAIPHAAQKMSILWDFRRYAKTLGLYDGRRIERFLREKIGTKIPSLLKQLEINFHDLQENGGKQLKIVATDLQRREPAVFEHGPHGGSSVIRAVRASTAYPFVFRPVEIEDTRLVDGGLASNVPVFLFREEQKRTRYPVFAFDVGAAKDRLLNGYGLNEYVRDLLTAALEAGDSALRRSLPGIEYIKVPLPDQLDALDFKVKKDIREALYNAGYEVVRKFLEGYYPLKLLAKLEEPDVKKELQTRYGPPTLYQPILAAVARECEQVSGAADVRASIMLPTMRPDGSRIVVYDYNMEGDSDQTLVLGEHDGCSGAAVKEPAGVMVADLEVCRRHPEQWGLSPEQAARVPSERKAMMSVAIPSWYDVADLAPGKLEKAHRIGVLSVDTITPLSTIRWARQRIGNEMASRLFYWAKILARLLSG